MKSPSEIPNYFSLFCAYAERWPADTAHALAGYGLACVPADATQARAAAALWWMDVLARRERATEHGNDELLIAA